MSEKNAMESIKLSCVQKFEIPNLLWPSAMAYAQSEAIMVSLSSKNHKQNVYKLCLDGSKKFPSDADSLFTIEYNTFFRHRDKFGVAHLGEICTFYDLKNSDAPTIIELENLSVTADKKSLLAKVKKIFKSKRSSSLARDQPSPDCDYSSILNIGPSDSLVHPVTYRGLSGKAFHYSLIEVNLDERQAYRGPIQSCSHSDFPLNDESLISSERPPQIESMGYRDGKLLACVVGRSGAKYGAHYHDLVVLDDQGRVVQTLFTEGTPGLYSEKKFGRKSIFTSDMKYCVITPMYQTDDWKGKPRLFDLKENKLIRVIPPRDFAKFDILDHFESFFWIRNWNHEVALCEANKI